MSFSFLLSSPLLCDFLLIKKLIILYFMDITFTTEVGGHIFRRKGNEGTFWLATTLCIWKHKNDILFNDLVCNLLDLILGIKMVVWYWRLIGEFHYPTLVCIIYVLLRVNKWNITSLNSRLCIWYSYIIINWTTLIGYLFI